MLKAIKNIFKPEKIVLSDGQEIQPPKSIVPYVIIGLVISILETALEQLPTLPSLSLT